MDLRPKKRTLLSVAGAVAFFSANAISPPQFVIETTVVGTLQDARLFGGSMARLSTNEEAQGLSCSVDPLTSFDYLGKIGTKNARNGDFSAAQIAYVTGDEINIYVDDTDEKKNLRNGFCYSGRIDMLALDA